MTFATSKSNGTAPVEIKHCHEGGPWHHCISKNGGPLLCQDCGIDMARIAPEAGRDGK